ncbi:U32 family peptidase [Emergencia timonensis]|uniref:peptidase U32 family protein n=1 Tax=Emergencia timonensis TaxID=1776384 RepID=UPI00082D27A9|nr:U32 family peptidase [Emergencia timonensis]WNX86742.1 U32 family peptidase [Emergencia timonensis]
MKRENFELLAPAGDLEKLKIAIIYGADAVYFGGEMFSLRAGAGNLSIDEMKEGIRFAHERGKRCYLTINIFAHNEDIGPLTDYLEQIKNIGIDAFIVSDPGIVDLIQEIIPDAEIHLSTQANMTNFRTARFWHKMGVKRLVLARELTFTEIKEIRKNIPSDMEIEAFVHGAMCISYSGRCLLSNFMIERDANRGMCAHPCRWKYSLVEEKRPGEYYPVEEDERGTYILNSRDLCMIEHLDKIVESGIMSAKVEGRMKSVFYVATVIHAYRQAIDAYFADPARYEFKAEWLTELKKVSHREFTTGFYFDKPTNQDQNYQTSAYTREYSFVGIVKSYDSATGYAVVEQRNKMTLGDEIEVFGPDIPFFKQALESMYDAESGEPLESAPHPQQVLRIKMDQPVKENYILRKAIRRSEI